MALYPAESLEFIINHVILPPRLPQEADNSKTSRAAGQHLLGLLSSKLDAYWRQYRRDNYGPLSAFNNAGDVIKTMLLRCATVVSTDTLSADVLTRLFVELRVKGVFVSSCHNLCCLSR